MQRSIMPETNISASYPGSKMVIEDGQLEFLENICPVDTLLASTGVSLPQLIKAAQMIDTTMTSFLMVSSN